MNRKCLFALLLSVLVVISGCVSAWKEERQAKYKSEPVDVTYGYSWEKVYDAYHYVFRNSLMPPIVMRSRWEYSHLALLTKEKRMVVMVYVPAIFIYQDIELDISFTPEGSNKTKVHIVKGVTVLQKHQEYAVKMLLDEVNFVLKNDGKGFFDYTKTNSLKWYRDTMAERMNWNYNLK